MTDYSDEFEVFEVMPVGVTRFDTAVLRRADEYRVVVRISGQDGGEGLDGWVGPTGLVWGGLRTGWEVGTLTESADHARSVAASFRRQGALAGC